MEIYRSLAEIGNHLPGPSAVALGYFDGIHLGHQKVLCSTAAFASIMTPCVFTFGHLPKKGAMILSPQAKYNALEKIGFQAVVSLDFAEVRGLSPLAFIHDVLIGAMGARVVCCGNNFSFGKDAAGNVELLIEQCDKAGVSVLTAGQVTYSEQRISSTAIRAAISQGEMERVRRMMGRPYSIDFEVIHGRQLGRTLDFPTINQAYPAGYCIPAFGVYATAALVDGVYLPAVTNVGVKPTVGSERVLAVAYIVACQRQLYGEHIQVYFLRHLRGEIKFENLDALKEQIAKDTASAKTISEQYIQKDIFQPF